MIYIYILIDPRTLEVRYVGKTNNPKVRFLDHVCNRVANKNNKRGIWAKELKRQGLKPIMQVLTTCKEEESQAYEYYYYKLFKDSCDLLNSATIAKDTYQYTLNLGYHARIPNKINTGTKNKI